MVVRVRSVVMSGCYYGSRSIGGWDPEGPEDPGQETETQNMHLGFVVIQQLTASPNRRCTTWEAFNALSRACPKTPNLADRLARRGCSLPCQPLCASGLRSNRASWAKSAKIKHVSWCRHGVLLRPSTLSDDGAGFIRLARWAWPAAPAWPAPRGCARASPRRRSVPGRASSSSADGRRGSWL